MLCPVAMRTECPGLRRFRRTSDKEALGPEKPTLHTLRSTLQPQGTHSDSESERRTRQKSRAQSKVGPRRLSGSPKPGCALGRLGHQEFGRWNQPGRRKSGVRMGTLQGRGQKQLGKREKQRRLISTSTLHLHSSPGSGPRRPPYSTKRT